MAIPIQMMLTVAVAGRHGVGGWSRGQTLKLEEGQCDGHWTDRKAMGFWECGPSTFHSVPTPPD